MDIVLRVAIGLLLVAAPQLTIAPVPIAQVQPLSLQELPTGEYYYQRLSASGRPGRAYVLLRKVGRTVIGLDAQLPNRAACFRGFIEGDRIVDATRVLPPYQPDSDWQHREGVMLDLAQYQRIPISPEVNPFSQVPYASASSPAAGTAVPQVHRAALQTCIESFWRS